MNALKYISEATSDDASGDELRTEEVEVPVAESIKVIEGNSSDQVQYVDYDLSNEKILGYVSLTNAKNVYEGVEEQKPVEEQEIEPLKYEGSDYVIKVEYTEEAQLPEGIHLEAEELQEGTEAYEDYYNRTVEKLMDESTAENEDELGISFARFFDLKFVTTEGEEIEPAAPVSVKIRYTDRVEVNDDQTATIVHFAKTTATAETDDSWTSKSDISKFSTFSLRPAALASDESADRTDNVDEIPEIITPEEVTNSTFEFVQDSFSVTATIIQNAENYDFVNGAEYIIYTDGNKALMHSDNNKLEVRNIEAAPKENENYNDDWFDSSLLWTYEDGRFYYQNGKVKYYLNMIENRNRYSYNISTYSSTTFSVVDGKILGKDTYYYEEKYIKLNNNVVQGTDKINDATTFCFAKIQTEYIPQGHATAGNISHTKFVKKYEDNTYDLTLDVSAGIGSKDAPAMLDVVFVLDVSKSMTGSDMTDIDNKPKDTFTVAKNTINRISENLKSNDKLNVRYALVTFSGQEGGTYDDAKSYDWGDKKKLSGYLAKAKADGGTNYQAGLLSANSLLDSARDGARTAVIFISDGNPGFYYDSEGNTKGTGDPGDGVGVEIGNNERTTYYYDPIAMAEAQIEIHKMNANYFCAVGIGSDPSQYNKLELLTEKDKFPKKGMKIRTYHWYWGNYQKTYEQNYSIRESLIVKYAAAKNSNSITTLLNEIQSDITSISAKKVTISDTLSEYAQFTAGAVPYLKVTDNNKSKDNKDYVIADGLNSVNVGGYEIKAAIDQQGNITMNFPDEYELPSNYTFSVTVRIEPTEKAIQLGQSGYLHTGGQGTGETSEGQPGFYSNATTSDGNSAAKVEFSYGGTTGTEYYNHPVIQVPEGFALPETGGPGTALIYLLGGMLLVTPLTIRVISRRRRERGNF